MFNGSYVKEIKIPETVHIIGNHAFANSKIKSIVIPKNVKAIGDYAFKGSDLEEVVLHRDIILQVNKDIPWWFENAFSGANKLKSIKITDDNGNITKNVDLKTLPYGIFKETILEEFELPESTESVDDNAFQDSKLKKINLETLKNLGWIEENSFRGTNLKEVVIPNKVNYIGPNAFATHSLEKVTIPASVDDAEYAFRYAINLKNVNLTGEWKKIPKSMFEESGIEDIHIPSSVDEIEDRAFANTKLKRVTIPYGVRKIGANVFEGTAIDTITLPETMTTFNSSSISNMPNLKSVYLPMNIKNIYIDNSFMNNVEFYVYPGSEAKKYLEKANFNLSNLLNSGSKAFIVHERTDSEYKRYPLNIVKEIGENAKRFEHSTSLYDEEAQKKTTKY